VIASIAPDERAQFRALYRNFIARIVDLELLSSRGDIGKLLAQLMAIVAAYNFTVALCFAPRFGVARIAQEKLMFFAWNDVEFLIATTLAIAGLFSVLAWNAVLPDRRDCIVLGLLPVRTRTIFAAKIAALGAALGIAVAAGNVFTGICYPFIVARTPGMLAVFRALLAYWTATAGAGLFICWALIAVQGVAAQLLPRRTFLKLSSFLQIAALFVIVGVYFIEPPLPVTPAMRASTVHGLFTYVPSFWFFGLFQKLNGADDPAFTALAGRALWSIAIACTAAAGSFAVAYGRSMRKIVEQPDITPGYRRRWSLPLSGLLGRPFDRTVLLFIARTFARSRQHRLMLSVYVGIGLGIALVYAKDLLYGRARSMWDPIYARLNPHESWNQVNIPLLVSSLVLLAFAVIGARAVFALPATLPANWMFRVTAVQGPAAYFFAIRRALYCLTAVPVWIASALFYFAVWPLTAALEHLAVLFTLGATLIEVSLHGFRKLPFACSYVPGKTNIHVKLGIWSVLFLFVTDRGAAIESWAMERPERFIVFSAILLVIAAWARRRTSDFASTPYDDLQFEDALPAAVDPLVLLNENA
jgi:hypothetical protein